MSFCTTKILKNLYLTYVHIVISFLENYHINHLNFTVCIANCKFLTIETDI